MTDPSAELVSLLEEHGPRLHRLLVRLTLREDVAEDLLQELFLKLRGSALRQRVKSLPAYARQTAMHLAFDWRRRQQRVPKTALLPGEPASLELPALENLVHREECEILLARLVELSDLSRDCLVLHYLEQEPYEAIAEQLGKSAHQVRALCYKAITQLRELLGVRLPESGKEVTHNES